MDSRNNQEQFMMEMEEEVSEEINEKQSRKRNPNHMRELKKYPKEYFRREFLHQLKQNKNDFLNQGKEEEEYESTKESWVHFITNQLEECDQKNDHKFLFAQRLQFQERLNYILYQIKKDKRVDFLKLVILSVIDLEKEVVHMESLGTNVVDLEWLGKNVVDQNDTFKLIKSWAFYEKFHLSYSSSPLTSSEGNNNSLKYIDKNLESEYQRYEESYLSPVNGRTEIMSLED